MASPIDYFDKDDAIHPYDTPEYYEWWYLDGMFENGWKCTVTYFWRTHSQKDHRPSILIDMYAPDGRKAHGYDVFEIADCKASTEKCDVVLGPNWLKQVDNDVYKLAINSNGIGAQLTFTRKAQGWKPSPTGLMIDGPSGHQGWCNSMPRADIEGELLFQGEKVQVKGLGYHDHNWGDCDMDKGMTGWGWGRMHSDRYTFVYGWLFPLEKDAPPKPALYVAMGTQPIFVSGDLPCKMSNPVLHAESGNMVPSIIEMGGSTPYGVTVNVKLTLESIMDWQKVMQASGFPMLYYRRLSHMVADIDQMGKKDKTEGEAIDEYVLMR